MLSRQRNSPSPSSLYRIIFCTASILHRIKGAICFNDFKTYEGVTYNHFKEIAAAMGLVESDTEILNIFEEACAIMMPIQLRTFFAWFVLSDSFVLSFENWNKFKEYRTFQKVFRIIMKIENY